MPTNYEIIEISSVEAITELSELLIDVVEDGASIGFLPPLDKKEAEEFWKGVTGPGVILWVVRVEDRIIGTIQLHLAQKANATHRAEVCKLMVHPRWRKKGIARALMIHLEKRAKIEDRSLLVLDTREGDPSNLLYQSLGYIEAGRIPYFAQSGEGSLDTTVLYYKQL